METAASGGVAKDGPTPGGGATALFPCLVYYPNTSNYSLIWVPMDGSNPAISQAAANAGSSPFQLPVQVTSVLGQGMRSLQLHLGAHGWFQPSHQSVCSSPPFQLPVQVTSVQVAWVIITS